MMTTDVMAPSLNDLNQLLRTVETKIALCEATGNDPIQRSELDQRRAEIQQQILDRGGDAPRLPYGDPD